MKMLQIIICFMPLIVVGLDGFKYRRRQYCATSLDREHDAVAFVGTYPVHKSTGQTDDISSYCIQRHNQYRRLHQVDDLIIDKHRLLSHARRVATELAANKSFEFSKLTYGINWGFTVGKWQCDMMTDKWYETGAYYNFTLRPEQANDKNRWFTQLIWSRTTHLACARSTAVPMLVDQRAKIVYWNVCIYDPKGNVEGQFRHNVFPPFDLKE